MQITELDINEIIPYVNNPRDNSGAIDAVASSIKEFGFNVPLVLDRDKIIVTGHTRLLAAKKLGLKRVPCIIAEQLTEAQAPRLSPATSLIADASQWSWTRVIAM
nr:MAG TPA: ParB protein [Caudoviricetes sp.]